MQGIGAASTTGIAAQKGFLIHILAFIAANGQELLGQASHLCDRPDCFNLAHIVDEHPMQNSSRKGCKGPMFCYNYGHCIGDVYDHQPIDITYLMEMLRRCTFSEFISILFGEVSFGPLFFSESSVPSSSPRLNTTSEAGGGRNTTFIVDNANKMAYRKKQKA